MSMTADEIVDETLLLIAESDYYDARRLNAYARYPLTQREIVTDSLLRALPDDKRQTVLWRLRRVELRWNKVMT
jgi:hypothetical protein